MFFRIVVPDYESLFEAVASKKYLAGIINSDVLGYYQEKIRNMDPPLRIVKRLVKPIPISVVFKKVLVKSDISPVMMKLTEHCLGEEEAHKAIVDEVMNKHRGYIKVII